MKTIIAIWGTEQIGKTTVIRETCKKLLTLKGATRRKLVGSLEKDDFYAEIDYNSKNIGIVSWGDPGSQQDQYLNEALFAYCDIIIIACRTKGATITNIINAAKNPNDPNNPNYEVVWTSHFSGGNNGRLPNGLNLNDSFADALINLINQL